MPSAKAVSGSARAQPGARTAGSGARRRAAAAREARPPELPLPDEPLDVAARRLVGILAGRLRACEQRLRAARPDAEAVHDFRVTTRRLRAAIAIFGEALPSGPARAATKRLRTTGKVAGEARDLEVMAADLQRHREGSGGRALDAVIARWNRRRERALARLVKHLDGGAYAALLDCLDRVGAPRAEPSRTKVRHAAPAVVWSALGEARAAVPGGPPAFEDLHALRIRVKRLRYAIEFLQNALPAVFPLVERLVALQDRLGRFEDARSARWRIEDDLAARTGRGIGVAGRRAVLGYLATLDASPASLAGAAEEVRALLEGPEVRRALADAVAEL